MTELASSIGAYSPIPPFCGGVEPRDGEAMENWPANDEIVRTEFGRLMHLAGELLKGRLPVAMVAILGHADSGLGRGLRERLQPSAECVGWAGDGPLLTILMRRSLTAELAPLMRELFLGHDNLHVGVAASNQLADADDLWLATRLALKAAVAKGESLVVLDENAAAHVVAEYRMATAMRRDLQDGGRGFAAHFQPQVRLDTGQPVGVEALARWSWSQHPLPPSTFIPVAEKFGLMGRLGELMLGLSACALKALRSQGIVLPRMAVNVSAGEMLRQDFLRLTLDALRSEGLTPADIELEISESVAGGGAEDVRLRLGELATAGFGVAIDDFGTGTSTLARLRDVAAGKLKLDRSLVRLLPGDMSTRRSCSMAVGLARSLGMTSLAQGVETPEQANYLRISGCRLGQGYLWARPMPAEHLARWWGRSASGGAAA